MESPDTTVRCQNWPLGKLRDFLLRNGMTPDALWYGEGTAGFGLAEAGPMNLCVCRSLGRIELKRLLREAGLPPPRDREGLRRVFWKLLDPFPALFFGRI